MDTATRRRGISRPRRRCLVPLRPVGSPEREEGPGSASPGLLKLSSLEAIFPPIADYAFLSDCENTCLVGPTGAIEWLCLPRPHDPSVFGTILDRAAGSLRLAPADTAVPANRRYVPGTMVLATTWQTRTGWLAVRDFLADRPWHRPPTARRCTGARPATSTPAVLIRTRRACTARSTWCSTASRRSTMAVSMLSGSTRGERIRPGRHHQYRLPPTHSGR